MAGRGDKSGLMEEVLTIRMHTKVTKGGRNLNFAALVAVGDGNGKIGLGYGKATGVPQAIEKAGKRAKESMIKVPLVGDTLSHEQIGEHKSSRVLLKPAAPGTGIKAGGTIRSMLQVLGIHNVLTKSLGRNNPINLAQAAMNALALMRPLEEVQKLRGRDIALKHPQWSAKKQKKEHSDDKGQQPAVDAGSDSSVDAAAVAAEASDEGPDAGNEKK